MSGVLAVYNMKGGVGKTSATAYRALWWDVRARVGL